MTKSCFFLALIGVLFSGLAQATKAQTVFMVQLGTFESESEAQSHWVSLSSEFSDLFEDLRYTPNEIVSGDDNFVSYRTQAGPLSTREEAQNLCDVLSGSNQECYVVETAMFFADDAQVEALEARVPDAIEAAVSDVAQESEVQEVTALAQAPIPDVVPAPVVVPTPQERVAAPTPIEVYGAPAVQPSQTRLQPIVKPAPVQAPAPIVQAPQAIPQPVAAPAQVVRDVAAQPTAQPTADTAYALGVAQPATRVAAPQVTAPAPQPLAAPASTITPVPPAEVAPITGNARGNIVVAEAIPVPLSEPKRNPYLERGNHLMDAHPSSSARVSSFWAEISHFASEAAATHYVQLLKSRDSLLPSKLRIRITRPYGRSGGAQKLSLRMGPFITTRPIRRLCALTRPEGLRCRAIKDVGGSVRRGSPVAARTRGNAGGSRYTQYRQQAQAQATTPRRAVNAANGGSGQYFVQLGSFLSQRAADDKWEQLRQLHSSVLRGVSKSVAAPQRSSTNARLYRLRTGPFGSYANADRLCAALKRQGTLCLVVKR